jgi:hypothetical protein
MRLVMIVTLPHEPFNAAVRDGSVSEKMGRIVDGLKPEALYFGERHGKRTAFVVVDIADASQIPSIAEPWFLTFGAEVELHPVMVPEDLMKAGLEGLGKIWG